MNSADAPGPAELFELDAVPEPPAAPTRAAKKPAKPAKPAKEPAATLPVARVCVDLPLPHLDRPFDYLVPAKLDAQVVVGGRVRIRFAGQLVDGVVLDRVEASEHGGRLAFLERAVSAEPALSPEIAVAAREIADRCAGTLADVLRLAIPPRHARAEDQVPAEPAAAPPAGDNHGWAPYPHGPAYLRALSEGRSPRAVWSALPGEDWPARIAEAMAATLASGRGAVAIVPDARDLERLDAALTTRLGTGRHVTLNAALGPEERYRR